MDRFLHSFFLIILTAAGIGAQSQALNNKAFIEWNEFYDLRWEDFQGKPGDDAAGDAGTSVQIKAKPYLVKKKVKYDVYVLFNKDKSWSRDKSIQLLAHEQLHFDLAEVYARRIRKKVRELNEKKIEDVNVYNEAIQKILDESNEADGLYDIETLHGMMDKKQAEWAKKIQNELVSLKSYKKHKRVITAG